MRTLLLLVLGLGTLAACHHRRHHSSGGSGTPVFVEQERNDDPLTANDFGTLRPGDRFIIEGFVRDDLADPFDHFAFRSAGPLHVDFELIANHAAADLDVCLYDSQLDQVVDCFTSEVNPELGGVDVFAGGLRFQLLVESFIGDSTYSLVITVLPLFAREGLQAEIGPGLRGTGAIRAHGAKAEQLYRKAQPAPRMVFEQVLRYDAEANLMLETIRLRR